LARNTNPARTQRLKEDAQGNRDARRTRSRVELTDRRTESPEIARNKEINLPRRVAKKTAQEKIPTEVRASYACHIQLNLIEELLRDMPALRVSSSVEATRKSLQRSVTKLNAELGEDLKGYIDL